MGCADSAGRRHTWIVTGESIPFPSCLATWSLVKTPKPVSKLQPPPLFIQFPSQALRYQAGLCHLPHDPHNLSHQVLMSITIYHSDLPLFHLTPTAKDMTCPHILSLSLNHYHRTILSPDTDLIMAPNENSQWFPIVLRVTTKIFSTYYEA